MKILKTLSILLFIGLTLTSYAQERGHSFSPNYQGYYYLRTAFTGDALSLESNGSSSSTMSGASFMSSQKGATGTMWKLVPDAKNKGWYRLKSKDQGDGKCLEANSAGGEKEGRSFMDNCQDVTGQLWRLDLVSATNGDHLYRLRTMAHGNDFSLEGNNRVNNAVYSGNSFMDKTQNVSGQMWRLVPVQ
jgi:Ricin-type beta-trefoil lectin domain-like